MSAGATSESPGSPSTGMVDWGIAVSTAARTTRPGPEVPLAEAREIVGSLRALAVEARSHVADVTGLRAPVADAPVAVVDRAAWVKANAAGFQNVVDPLVAQIRERRAGST